MSQDHRSCFDTVLKVLALVMAVGLVISLPLALAGRSFGRVLFRPIVLSSVVQNSVLESGVLESAMRRSLLSREWFDSIRTGEEDVARYFEHLSPGEREEIFYALLPTDWIESQINQLLREFYKWLDDENPVPVFMLDLVPLKTNLLRGGINAFVDTVVDSWPSCKPEQVEALQQEFFEGGQLPETLCEPPEPLRSRVVDLATIAFEEQVRLLPDAAPLIEDSTTHEELFTLKEQLRFFRAIMLWGWMLPLSLLGLIMTFAIRSWRDFGRWWGLPLLLGGIGSLLLALMLSAAQEGIIREWTAGLSAGGPISEIFTTGLNALYRAGMRPLWIQAMIVLMISLLLWFISRRAQAKPQVVKSTVKEAPTAIAAPLQAPSELEVEQEEEGEPPEGIFG
jgi:hypothetical protein